jgi:hypothetical protein
MPPSKKGNLDYVTGPARSTSPPFSGSAGASILLDLSSHDSAENLLPGELANVSATEDRGVGDGGVNIIDVG